MGKRTHDEHDADPASRPGLVKGEPAPAMARQRYVPVITEAVIEDAGGNLVGRIRLMRAGPLDRGRYHWKAGFMNRFPLGVDAEGTSPSYEDARSALVDALSGTDDE
jgi:hypothetical protein